MTSPLEKTLWTAPIPALAGVQITEVDMASAGMTVIRQEKLLPAHLIARLESVPKAEQSVVVGKLSRLEAYRGLAGEVTKGIKRRIKAMAQENGVGDERILSIKRDAIFVMGDPPRKLTLADGTLFRVKNSYNCFAKLGPVEVYCTPRRKKYDLKGMDDEKAELHRDFIMLAVMDILRMMEKNELSDAAATIERLRVDYVKRALPLGFYREFNNDSSYALMAGGNVFRIEEVGEDIPLADLQISYNLRNVILPLARALA